ARWPADRPESRTENAWETVPEIAAEVVSPNDEADELLAKVREYLRGGVRLVWVVYPTVQEVHAYWPGATTIRVYAGADELDTGKPAVLVPGNNESADELAAACRGWPGCHVLHGTAAVVNGVPFFGVGGGIPVTPFGSWSYDFDERQGAALLAAAPAGCVLVV